MSYQIKLSEEARKSLRRLPGNYRQRARRLIEALATNPRPKQAKSLRNQPNGYRIWLDRWRIIYRVDDENLVILIAGVRWKKGPDTQALT